MEEDCPAAFEIRHCANAACNLRFPVFGAELEAGQAGQICPRCGAHVEIVHRQAAPAARAPDDQPVAPHGTDTGSDMCAVLDNLRSAFNVGSIFRAADGVGLCRLYLCGFTATPAQSKVAKTALGAETSINWSYHPNALETVAQLQAEGRCIVALEAAPHAHSLFDAARVLPTADRVALVVGNEVSGVDPHILARADHVLRIPMAGVKGSLNVAVAFGIAAYWLTGLRQRV